MMTYYQLRCKTCDELFGPVLSTEPEELHQIVNEEMECQMGHMNAEQLRNWQAVHDGHAWETVVNCVMPEPSLSSPA